MDIQDLAKKEHWDDRYTIINKNNTPKNWSPNDYNSLVIENILMTQINLYNPKTILEIGCGDSTWLPYIGKKTNAQITGIDYSEEGCRLARQRLNNEGVTGAIICEDIFNLNPESTGKYDFIYSLGVVEHYSDIQKILKTELQFVEKGGILFTEIPNLKCSIHRFLFWIYQPELLAKHNKLSDIQLVEAYENLGLIDINVKYAGLFTLTLVAWGTYPRWKTISKLTLPLILGIAHVVDYFLKKLKIYSGIAPFAPYIYIVGKKA